MLLEFHSALIGAIDGTCIEIKHATTTKFI